MNVSRCKSKIIHLLREFSTRQTSETYILSIVAKIMSLVCGFISTIVQAKYYGLEIIGLIAIYNSIFSIAGRISIFGIDTTSIRLISEKSISHPLPEVGWAIFKKASLIVVLFSTSFVAIIFGSIYGFEILSDRTLDRFNLLRWLLPFVIIQSWYQIGLSLLISTRMVRAYIFFDNISGCLNLILLLFITRFHYDRYNPLFTSYFTALLLAIILLFYLICKFAVVGKYKKIDVKYSEILSVSAPIFLIECINHLIINVDFWLLGLFNSLESVGIYQIIVRLADLSSLAMNTMNTLCAPRISKLYFESKMTELKQVVKEVNTIGTIIAVPVLSIGIIGGNLLLSIWGDRLTLGYTSMVILLCGQTINSACGSVANFLKLTGNQIDLMMIFITAAMLKIIFNVLLIPQIGMNGAAISSCITLIYWNLKSAHLILTKYHLWLPILPLRIFKIIGMKHS
jgi:O-antigen/teichoic acid export membrane protein